MEFPREHWSQIASTNPVERVNREVKRRADVQKFGLDRTVDIVGGERGRGAEP
jgi:transposase-like protein